MTMRKIQRCTSFWLGIVIWLSTASVGSDAFQNLFPKFTIGGDGIKIESTGLMTNKKTRELEDALLEAIASENRLSNSDTISALIRQLEQQGESSSIRDPAISDQLYGRWKLLYTTNADTSSPIQRKAVDTEKFPIYQDIVFDAKGQLKVNQIVQFSDSVVLSVDALASTPLFPLPELTERKGTGKILGLNILGVSVVGEEAAPKNPNARINFVFDEGNFDIANGKFRIPYPVPFRLPILRDAVKGWIDITYMSDRLRISKGNKGTTFVLLKQTAEP
jgi:hypothetical protein